MTVRSRRRSIAKGGKKCSVGTISRKGYTRRSPKTGKRVHIKRSCIKNVGLPGKYATRVSRQQRSISVRQAKAARMTSRRSNKACKPGEILRSPALRRSYTRKTKTGKTVKVSRTAMRATCIRNRGAPGRGKKKIAIMKDEHYLSQYGYKTSKSAPARHAAIEKLVASGKSPLAVRHMLIARSNLLKSTNPAKSKIMYKDQAWVKKHF